MSQRAKGQALEEEIAWFVEQLDGASIPWSYPADAANTTHSTKYRLAGHTKGNTKNQRKQMKHQFEQTLVATRDHLMATLMASSSEPTLDSGASPTQAAHTSEDNDDDEGSDESGDSGDGALFAYTPSLGGSSSSKMIASPTAGSKSKGKQGGGKGKKGGGKGKGGGL